MKKLIYILLLFVGITNAANIPNLGATFKAKLLESSTSNGIAKDSNGLSIQIDANNDSEISIAEANAVYELYIDNSNIDDLTGIENFINLTTLNVRQNLLTTIDVSALTNLSLLNIGGNSLHTMYAKNGNVTDSIDFSGGSNNDLSYICIDEAQVQTMINQLGGGSTCVVNSYCTSSPGGNFTTISGTIAFDATSNGIDASDPKFPFIKVKCEIGSDTFQTISDQNGNYVFYTQQTTGNFTITPKIESDGNFGVVTPFVGNLSGSNVVHDFAITPIAVTAPDLEVIVSPESAATAGSNALYLVTYKNKGSKSVTGNVLLNYDSANASFVSSTNPNVITTSPGQVSLHFTDLLPFETRSFYVALAISSGVSSTTPLVFSTSITDDLGATETSTVADNSFTYNQPIGAVSDNAMTCLQGNTVDGSQIGQYLHYKISFKNSGTSLATNVVVKTVFDTTKFDMNSLQILNSSRPANIQINGEKAFFNLNNANIGGPGGDGGILLKIKSNTALTVGQTVSSRAEIFFDYGSNFSLSNVSNSSVTTTIANTTFQNLSLAQNSKDTSIAVYPNPTNALVFIDSKNTINTVELFDIYGRLLQVNLSQENKTSIDMSERTAGTYFLKITSDKGTKIEKIVKN